MGGAYATPTAVSPIKERKIFSKVPIEREKQVFCVMKSSSESASDCINLFSGRLQTALNCFCTSYGVYVRKRQPIVANFCRVRSFMQFEGSP